jgi:hypothetical protein
LREALKNLAAVESSLAAPERVEESLRMAFRRQSDTARQVVAAKKSPLRSRMALAAAFLAGLVLGALTIRRFLEPPPDELKPTTTVVLAPAAPPVQKAAAERLGALERPSAKPESGNAVRSGARTAPRRAERRRPAGVEIMTDFIPLTYAGALMEQEGAQLLRVQMPRSALISLGMPVAVENAREPVKADVLFGHDGVARAIRFVR